MTNVSRSRAMAVAAHDGRAYVYALKSMDEMKAEFQRNLRIGPIGEVSTQSTQLAHTFRLILSYFRKSLSPWTAKY